VKTTGSDECGDLRRNAAIMSVSCKFDVAVRREASIHGIRQIRQQQTLLRVGNEPVSGGEQARDIDDLQ
jgi:hypothetical protein